MKWKVKSNTKREKIINHYSTPCLSFYKKKPLLYYSICDFSYYDTEKLLF